MKFMIFVLLVFVGTVLPKVHFNDTRFDFHKVNDKKDVQVFLNSSNETQTLNGYFLLNVGDPIKLKFEPFNLKKDLEDPQEITLTLNTTSGSTILQFVYVPKKLIITGGNDEITYTCDSVCNKALDFEITSEGYFRGRYNERLSSTFLNQTIKGAKTEYEKEMIYFSFEWSNNTAYFLITVRQSNPVFSPKYLLHPNHPSFPAITHSNNGNEKKIVKSETWIWITMIIAFAAFGIITTFLCVQCRLSPTRQSSPYGVPTTSDDDDL
uniref:Transmembrane protein n=1 Tax=Panagrolaimus sp. PS1159 TaxID=55785 RepID=A0AC35F4Q7_9BILA